MKEVDIRVSMEMTSMDCALTRLKKQNYDQNVNRKNGGRICSDGMEKRM